MTPWIPLTISGVVLAVWLFYVLYLIRKAGQTTADALIFVGVSMTVWASLAWFVIDASSRWH